MHYCKSSTNRARASIVANAVKQGYWYDPLLDLNNDGFVDEADIHIVDAIKERS